MTRTKKAFAMSVAAVVALAVIDAGAHAEAPPGQYTDLGDGTVRDNETGLVWQQRVDDTTVNQAAAISHCDALTFAGRTDWRLPSVLELRSIVDETRSAPPTIDVTFFPDAQPTYFWSATPVASSSVAGWSVAFDHGYVYDTGLATNAYRVRCVR
jgi:hypothetical protein